MDGLESVLSQFFLSSNGGKKLCDGWVGFGWMFVFRFSLRPARLRCTLENQAKRSDSLSTYLVFLFFRTWAPINCFVFASVFFFLISTLQCLWMVGIVYFHCIRLHWCPLVVCSLSCSFDSKLNTPLCSRSRIHTVMLSFSQCVHDNM